MAASSGTFSWGLNNSDIILEAFSRAEIRPPAITGPMMIEAKRSLNLELQRWANAGMPLLWAVDLITVDLLQGVATYSLPIETADLLDVYVRLFTLGTTFNVTPNFSTVNTSTAVTVVVSNHGLVTGNYINITTPVAIANLLLSGYYQVASVVDTNTFTITSPVAATSTVNNGGVVPEFTAVAGQAAIQVTLPNHGETVNSLFNVAASTTVGGITLYGAYTVTGVTSSSVFGISTLQNCITNDTQYENTGLVQILAQEESVQPIDYIMTPLGRTDYADIPNKAVQGRPTSYWYDRIQNQTITLWQVPDGNGPYQLQAYRMRRLQDASPTMGQLPDVPYRALDALCGQMAVRLAMKYNKQLLPIIKADADAAFNALMDEDRERAQIYLIPGTEVYYR